MWVGCVCGRMENYRMKHKERKNPHTKRYMKGKRIFYGNIINENGTFENGLHRRKGTDGRWDKIKTKKISIPFSLPLKQGMWKYWQSNENENDSLYWLWLFSLPSSKHIVVSIPKKTYSRSHIDPYFAFVWITNVKIHSIFNLG